MSLEKMRDSLKVGVVIVCFLEENCAKHSRFGTIKEMDWTIRSIDRADIMAKRNAGGLDDLFEL